MRGNCLNCQYCVKISGQALFELRWYLFLEPEPRKYAGHNPLAQMVMFTVLVFNTIFMIVTGFALYSEGEGKGSWADTLFGWVIPMMGQSQDVHTWHHLGMWVMVLFMMTHIYVAIH